ncbi:PAS domain-containing protein [Kiritimatiellaeota bacterium B1221]|nr:PAS domain-containing protein [Kiritimatiellaeota bacterium B1221]
MDFNQISIKGEEMLTCLLSVTSENFLVMDMDGKLQEVNHAFCKFAGRPREDFISKSLFDLEPNPSDPVLKKHWAEICASKTYTTEFKFLLPNGVRHNMTGNFCVHTFDEGGLIFLFCKEIAVDPEKLNLLNLQTEALASTANAVVITDDHGLIVWANRAFSRYTGYSMEEAVGSAPGVLLKSGKHPVSFYTEMWETIRRGDIWQGELINRRKDGSLYPEEMTITPLFNEEGEITHYIAIKQDVSEKKNLQEMFLRAQRLESVGTLASGVAHDLNNVLSPIVMSADLLMVQTKDQHTNEMLLMIKDSAKRGADIIRQLLTFVRGEDEELVEMQVRHLLKELVKVFRETFPRYITIEDRIAVDLHPIKGNATNLHQVFTNLMINARDAMPKGGNLLLKVENVTLDEAQAREIEGARAGMFVRVRVEDEGTGIPIEMQQDIFESFFTTKGKGEGTGLGLPTSVTILKKHHGFLTLHSEVGRGSTFDVYLPVFDGVFDDTSFVPEEELVYGNGESILVIDDEESIGFMLKGTLKSLNYNVKITNGGRKGLEWWMENREACKLILLDMMMPEMDGAEVYKHLKEQNCQSKILIMSGMVSEEKLMETGVDLKNAFITKPFAIVDLAKKIRNLLDT